MHQLAVGQFQQLAAGIYLEGLAVDQQRDMVWYSDVVGGGLYGIRPNGGIETLNPGRMWTGGVMMNHDGSVLSSGQGGIMWNNPDSGKSGWLINEINGSPVNGINEMVPDGSGGIFFGTVDIDMVIEGATPRPTNLYRLTADREVILLAEGIGFTNGIMFDSSRKTFYCNDTFNRTWAFDVTEDLTLTNKRPFFERDDVDGMALDADGNVWITGFQHGVLTRVSPDGALLDPVETPGEAITQVRFGGSDACDFYINCVPIDGGESLKNGETLTEHRSFLYRGRSESPGRVMEPARFTIG
ncbi:SMP-30/gluconolactonase/LRE family protein [Haliea sp. E17]|uniref:SMP-30/gluconolactonase/LRE family protein n=1 Tax=Haliea sp. E17 TaxID=3401576 RepID=UPI003AAD8A04